MVEADRCERCDGRGCRYCSGRGWVNRALPAIPICRKDYPPITAADIDEMSDWPTNPPAARAEAHGRTKEDTEVRGVELQDEDEPEDWPPEVCRACNQATGIDDRNGLCADCNREVRKLRGGIERELAKNEPEEPEEKVRITVEYPGQTVKLIKVRYGTLSKALAEALDGRPWS